MNSTYTGYALAVILVVIAGQHIAFGAEPVKGSGSRVMVWQLEAKTGVSSKDIDSLSGYVTSQVEQYSGHRVISEADVSTVLKGAEARQRCGVNDDATACMAEIGNALGVPEAVAGDLGRVGQIWILNLRRIDLRNVSVIRRISRQVRGDDITPVVEALPMAVAELFGKQAQPAAAVSAPDGKPVSVFQKTAYGTFFSGVALIGLGGIGSWQMKSARDDYSAAAAGSSAESDASDRHETWKAVSATAYALGGALMITGITLWILDAVKAPSSGDEARQVTFTIAPADRGATVGVWGRW